MSDLINRQAAIDTLWKALYEYEDDTEKKFQESEELDVADWFLHRIFVQNMSDIDRQTILNLPSAQPEQHWIPCSERLPDDVEIGEEYPTVIFCTSDGAVYVGGYEHYLGGKWWYMETWEDEAKGVIAWMPLPEPWRGEDHVPDE